MKDKINIFDGGNYKVVVNIAEADERAISSQPEVFSQAFLKNLLDRNTIPIPQGQLQTTQLMVYRNNNLLDPNHSQQFWQQVENYGRIPIILTKEFPKLDNDLSRVSQVMAVQFYVGQTTPKITASRFNQEDAKSEESWTVTGVLTATKNRFIIEGIERHTHPEVAFDELGDGLAYMPDKMQQQYMKRTANAKAVATVARMMDTIGYVKNGFEEYEERSESRDPNNTRWYHRVSDGLKSVSNQVVLRYADNKFFEWVAAPLVDHIFAGEGELLILASKYLPRITRAARGVSVLGVGLLAAEYYWPVIKEQIFKLPEKDKLEYLPNLYSNVHLSLEVQLTRNEKQPIYIAEKSSLTTEIKPMNQLSHQPAAAIHSSNLLVMDSRPNTFILNSYLDNSFSPKSALVPNSTKFRAQINLIRGVNSFHSSDSFSVDYDSEHGFDHYKDDADITLGLSVFGLTTTGKLIFAPTIEASIAFDLTTSMVATGLKYALPAIGLGYLGYQGIKGIYRYIQFESLPLEKQSEVSMNQAFDWMKKVEDKSIGAKWWLYYSLGRKSWDELYLDSEKNLTREIKRYMRVHMTDPAVQFHMQARLHALKHHLQELYDEWPQSNQQTCEVFKDYLQDLYGKFQDALTQNKKQEASRYAEELTQLMPRSFYSELAQARVSDLKGNFLRATDEYKRCFSYAKTAEEKSELDASYFAYLWRKTAQNQGYDSNELKKYNEERILDTDKKCNDYFLVKAYDFENDRIHDDPKVLCARLDDPANKIEKTPSYQRLLANIRYELAGKEKSAGLYSKAFEDFQKIKNIVFEDRVLKGISGLCSDNADYQNNGQQILEQLRSEKAKNNIVVATTEEMTQLIPAFKCLANHYFGQKNFQDGIEILHQLEKMQQPDDEINLALAIGYYNLGVEFLTKVSPQDGNSNAWHESAEHFKKLSPEMRSNHQYQLYYAFACLHDPEFRDFKSLENQLMVITAATKDDKIRDSAYVGLIMAKQAQAQPHSLLNFLINIEQDKIVLSDSTWSMLYQAALEDCYHLYLKSPKNAEYFDRCIELSNKLIDKNANHVFALLIRGYVFLYSDNPLNKQRSKEQFEKVVSYLSPSKETLNSTEKEHLAKAYVGLSDYYLSQDGQPENYQQAVNLRIKAVRISESALNSELRTIVKIYQHLGKPQEGVQFLFNLVQEHPKHPGVNLNYIALLASQGDYENAKQHLKCMLENNELKKVAEDASSVLSQHQLKMLGGFVMSVATLGLREYTQTKIRHHDWYIRIPAKIFNCAFDLLGNQVIEWLPQYIDSCMYRDLKLQDSSQSFISTMREKLCNPIEAVKFGLIMISILRAQEIFDNQGHFKTAADVAQHSLIAASSYQKAESVIKYFSEHATDFYTNLDFYFNVILLPVNGIANHVTSQQANRGFQYEHQGAYIVKDLSKIGITASAVYALSIKFPAAAAAAGAKASALWTAGLAAQVGIVIGGIVVAGGVTYIIYQRSVNSAYRARQENAEWLLRQGDYQNALLHYDALIKEQPNAIEMQFRRDQIHRASLLKEGRYQEVIHECTQIIATHSDPSYELLLRSEAFLNSGRFVQAEQDLILLVKLNKKGVEHIYLSGLYQGFEHYDYAIKHAQIFRNQLVQSLGEAINHATLADKDRWSFFGLTDQLYTWVKSHRRILDPLGINDSWFSQHVSYKQATEQAEVLKQQIDQIDGHITKLTGLNKAQWINLEFSVLCQFLEGAIKFGMKKLFMRASEDRSPPSLLGKWHERAALTSPSSRVSGQANTSLFGKFNQNSRLNHHNSVKRPLSRAHDQGSVSLFGKFNQNSRLKQLNVRSNEHLVAGKSTIVIKH